MVVDSGNCLAVFLVWSLYHFNTVLTPELITKLQSNYLFLGFYFTKHFFVYITCECHWTMLVRMAIEWCIIMYAANSKLLQMCAAALASFSTVLAIYTYIAASNRRTLTTNHDEEEQREEGGQQKRRRAALISEVCFLVLNSLYGGLLATMTVVNVQGYNHFIQDQITFTTFTMIWLAILKHKSAKMDSEEASQSWVCFTGYLWIAVVECIAFTATSPLEHWIAIFMSSWMYWGLFPSSKVNLS